MYCQLVYICGCMPGRIRHALAELPETLDETYERTLREINKADWEFAYHLFQFVAVAVRPLSVEELAELLAFDFKAGPIPKFHTDWRVEDPMDAILSTCPSFLAIVDSSIFGSHRKVVQFSHFSVKEFLTSTRLAEANDIFLRRYHVSQTPAHTLAAQACLGYFLHLDKGVTRDSLRKLPFTDYAEYWVDHARSEEVSRNVKDGLKELLDPSKPYLAVCIWICDPTLPSWKRLQSEKPSPLRGTPLHYAALWDLDSVVELLVNELSQNVNSQYLADSETPLHVASSHGHMKIACRLLDFNADVEAQDKNKETPLHVGSKHGQLKLARMLIERGASMSAQNMDGQTPLHLVSEAGRVDVVRMLIESGVDVSAQDKDGQTPLHLALKAKHVDIVYLLIKRGADVSAQNKDGQTPLHLAYEWQPSSSDLELIDGAYVSARNKLHLASQDGWKVVRMLIEHGASVSVRNKDGQIPLQCMRRSMRRAVC